MSALESMRTEHPPIQAGSTQTRPRTTPVRCRVALKNAAITIPQLLRQRAAIHGDAARAARKGVRHLESLFLEPLLRDRTRR